MADGGDDDDVVVHAISTPEGPARVRVRTAPESGRGTVLLSHGAGGHGDSADLAALARSLTTDGWVVGLVDQPWRVAGKRVATAPPRLDAAYVPVVRALRDEYGLPPPLISAGRSAGARVVCRTAATLGADAVVALSFPLHPPGRPQRSRYGELAAAVGLGIPISVVQGEKDAFGTPDELTAAGLDPDLLTVVRGTHSPNPADVVAAVRAFLDGPLQETISRNG
ncbi:MAG: alpha/beta family hydrolase [Dermatophilaceae bacterium]